MPQIDPRLLRPKRLPLQEYQGKLTAQFRREHNIPKSAIKVWYDPNSKMYIHENKSSHRPRPDNFDDIELIIKSDLPIPHNRRDDRRPAYENNFTTYKYPIHKKTNPDYRLLCAFDKMKVGDYMQSNSREVYEYIYSKAQQYAQSLRINKRYPIPMRFKCVYDSVLNIGRMWRIE